MADLVRTPAGPHRQELAAFLSDVHVRRAAPNGPLIGDFDGLMQTSRASCMRHCDERRERR